MVSENYILFLFQSILWTLAAGEDACRCSDHILCLHPGSSPGPKCNEYIESGLTSEEKMAIVNATNSFRSRIAMGKESSGNPGPQPSAADMMEVTWDDYLALTSQRWADQCEVQESVKRCRITGGGEYLTLENEYFGENFALAFYHPKDEDYEYHDGLLDMITRWEDEVNYFPRGTVDHFNPYSMPRYAHYGYYANLVNGKTYAIGCGRTHASYNTYFVCHYKPGPYYPAPLYTRGKPASKCPYGTIPSKYEGLCAFGIFSRREMRLAYREWFNFGGKDGDSERDEFIQESNSDGKGIFW